MILALCHLYTHLVWEIHVIYQAKCRRGNKKRGPAFQQGFTSSYLPEQKDLVISRIQELEGLEEC